MIKKNGEEKAMEEPIGNTKIQTPAFITFLAAEIRSINLLAMAGGFMAIGSRIAALKAEVTRSDDQVLLDRLTKLAKEFETEAGAKEVDRLLAEVSVCRAVDNFQCYLTDVLRAVFAVRPETLKSKQTVEIAEVLDCSTIGEFAGRVAERKTEELTYSGFIGITDFMTERLGVPIKLEDSCKQLASLAIAVRNVVVHNRGRANERFLRLTGRNDVKNGDLVPIQLAQTRTWFRALHTFAETIDDALILKFKRELFVRSYNSEVQK
jgi:hypothetical protein